MDGPWQVVARAMERRPQRRFQDAAEMQRALAGVLQRMQEEEQQREVDGELDSAEREGGESTEESW